MNVQRLYIYIYIIIPGWNMLKPPTNGVFAIMFFVAAMFNETCLLLRIPV